MPRLSLLLEVTPPNQILRYMWDNTFYSKGPRWLPNGLKFVCSTVLDIARICLSKIIFIIVNDLYWKYFNYICFVYNRHTDCRRCFTDNQWIPAKRKTYHHTVWQEKFNVTTMKTFGRSSIAWYYLYKLP